jgi:hypothetical protein
MGSTPSKTIRAICWANTKCTVQITTYSHQNLINFIREITVQNKHPLCQIWVGCWRERFPKADVDFDAVWIASLGQLRPVATGSFIAMKYGWMKLGNVPTDGQM